jgi:tetratricopeptide (TPR) repeat protein
MCASLCDAVLNDGAGGAAVQMPYPAVSGDSFCQDVLEELERANLFVVPLDDARQWYRYHHLFGEMLRARLLRGGSEATLATLHRRASAWYEGQGLVVEAVQHALAAHEWGTAARLIKQHGTLLSMSGQSHTVLGWLEALPPWIVQQSPTLCQVHAVGLVFTNRFDAAEVRLQDAEHALKPDTPADRARHARGSMAVIRGDIRLFTGDLAQAISLMQHALELLPELPAHMSAGAAIARTRAVAALYAASAYQLTGDVTEASERRVTATIAPARATGYLTEMVTSYSYLAWLQVLQGRLRTAAATYTEIERLVPGLDALHALDSSPAYYFGIGDLRREWNDLDAAQQHLRQARRAQSHPGAGTGARTEPVVTLPPQFLRPQLTRRFFFRLPTFPPVGCYSSLEPANVERFTQPQAAKRVAKDNQRARYLPDSRPRPFRPRQGGVVRWDDDEQPAERRSGAPRAAHRSGGTPRSADQDPRPGLTAAWRSAAALRGGRARCCWGG